MVLRWVSGFERDIGQRLKVEEAGALGSWARACAGASFEPGEMQQTQPRELVALLAAMATDPELLEPLRRRFEAWQARAEHSTWGMEYSQKFGLQDREYPPVSGQC